MNEKDYLIAKRLYKNFLKLEHTIKSNSCSPEDKQKFKQAQTICIKRLKHILKENGISYNEFKSLLKRKESHSKQQTQINRVKVEIYTDGSCEKSKLGSYTAILRYADSVEKIITGIVEDTTSTDMEFYAVVVALSKLTRPCNIELYVDFKAISDVLTLDWVKDQDGTWFVKNQPPCKLSKCTEKYLYRILDLIDKGNHSVIPVWVKGHSGNVYNEACDAICKNTREEYKHDRARQQIESNEALKALKQFKRKGQKC